MSDRAKLGSIDPDIVPPPTPADAESADSPVERTSERLLRAVATDGGREVSVGDLVTALEDRAFGLVLLILALPNCVPAPPGIGGITGIVIAIFAVQMLLGRDRPWLPAFLDRRRFDRTAIRRMLLRTAPYIRRFERVSRPRLFWATGHNAERPLGAAILLLAFVVSLPVPLTNWVPGVAIAVIAIGLIEQDGAAVLLGLVLGAVGMVLAISVTGAFVVFLAGFFTQVTG